MPPLPCVTKVLKSSVEPSGAVLQGLIAGGVRATCGLALMVILTVALALGQGAVPIIV